ncbi:hypothetical protein [Priestia megaterium]
MENNREETNSTSPVNLDEKEKKPFTTYMMDASIIVLALTALTYMLGMKYKQGYLSYYGISNFMTGSVEISFLINSFLQLLVTLLLCSLLYLWVLPYLFNSKFNSMKYSRLYYYSSLILFFWACFLAYLYTVFNISVNSNRGKSLLVFLLVMVNLLLEINNVRFYRKITRPVINFITNIISPFISFVIRHKPVKFIALMIFIFIMTLSFINLGEISAQQREEYLIIKYKVKDKKTEKIKETDFVVIAEDKDNLLIAPVNLGEKKITPTYSIIEVKSELNKLVKLEAMKFDGGLKVRQVKDK